MTLNIQNIKLNKVEVCISSSKVFMEDLQCNVDIPASNFFYLNPKSLIEDNMKAACTAVRTQTKIDLLILDCDDISVNLSARLRSNFYNIKNILILVNESTNGNIKSEPVLQKPFKIKELLKVIQGSRSKNLLFCNINDLLYDEQLSTLWNTDFKIRLTEKENAIFKYLILIPNNTAHIAELARDVWQYRKGGNQCESIETYLYRFKQKLPDNLIEVKDNCYKLIMTPHYTKNM